ncbi:MAG TPA: hypothetical protein DIT40_08245 [Alphaproteobacteria bacterium]|nr:hypothetical protein [Alphaproteobacteria bacterium]
MPEWLKGFDLQDLANGVIALILGFVVWIGRQAGRKSSGSKQVEVAGALISGKDAERIIHAIEQNTAASDRATAAADRVASTYQGLRREVGDLRGEMRDLHDQRRDEARNAAEKLVRIEDRTSRG